MSTTKWQPIDPGYYSLKIIEPITVIEGWGLGYHLGCAVSYIARCEDKGNRRDDLIKAANYCYREATGEWLPKELLNGKKTEMVEAFPGGAAGDPQGLAEALRSYPADSGFITRMRDVAARLGDPGRAEDPRGAEAPRRSRRKQNVKVQTPTRVRSRLRRSGKRKA